MSQFFFHIRAGDQAYHDSEGVELTGIGEALMHALDLAQRLSTKRTMGNIAAGHFVDIGKSDSHTIASLPFERATVLH